MDFCAALRFYFLLFCWKIINKCVAGAAKSVLGIARQSSGGEEGGEAAYKLPKTRSNFPVSMSPSTLSSASSSSSPSLRLPAIVYSHSSKWLEKLPLLKLPLSTERGRAPSPQFGCLWSLGVSVAHIFCVVVLYSDALSASPLVAKKKKKRKKIVATVFTSSSLLFFAQTPCGLLERENGCPFPGKSLYGADVDDFSLLEF